MGIMWQQGKDFPILKDRRLPILFTNITPFIYNEFDGEMRELSRPDNKLYRIITEWLKALQEYQLATQDNVFVTGLENIIENPAKAIEYFEKQMWQCMKTIARYARIKLPRTKDPAVAIKFLHETHQITTFIGRVMLECRHSCHKLKTVEQLSLEQRNQLLGWA